MQVKIFYSWQSDTDKKYNLSFIQKAIEKAIKNLQSEYDIYVEWILDRDTSGVLGTIDIVETIFKKITESHIFIGELWSRVRFRSA